MQARFKFRIWDKETKDFDCPFYLDRNAGLYSDSWCEGLEHELEEERYIIQQCTGLKDKNGKLIYEGDIVKINTQGEILINYGIVFWNDKEAKFLRTSNLTNIDKQDGQSFWYNKSIEIIGNIYENPELLGDIK